MSSSEPPQEDALPEDGPSPEARRTRASALPPSRPLLASEALKDDLAPFEPFAREGRRLALGAGMLFGAMALAPAWRPSGWPWVEVATSAVLLAAGSFPLRYSRRAALLLGAGLASGLAGVLGLGGASVAAYALGEWGVVHLLAALVLPCALLFRCHYRAYPIARPLVAAALVLSLPFAVATARAFDGTATLWVELTSAVALASLGAGLLGFTGAQTPLPAGWLATVVVTAMLCPIPAHAGARLGLSSATEWLSVVASTLAFGSAAGAAAVGAFQLLAGRHWTRARSIDVHHAPTEAPSAASSAPSLTDTWDDRR